MSFCRPSPRHRHLKHRPRRARSTPCGKPSEDLDEGGPLKPNLGSPSRVGAIRRGTFVTYQIQRIASTAPSLEVWRRLFPMPRLDHQKQIGHRWPPTQLALPLDYSASAPDDPPQSLAPSKRRRSRFLQARLEANLATLSQLDTVPGSLDESSDLNYFRQGQRFKLTSLLSSLITEVNGNRWPRNVSALPHIGKGEVAKFSEGRPFVRRGSLPDLQASSLGRH